MGFLVLSCFIFKFWFKATFTSSQIVIWLNEIWFVLNLQFLVSQLFFKLPISITFFNDFTFLNNQPFIRSRVNCLLLGGQFNWQNWRFDSTAPWFGRSKLTAKIFKFLKLSYFCHCGHTTGSRCITPVLQFQFSRSSARQGRVRLL
jgi:hypothetical protein